MPPSAQRHGYQMYSLPVEISYTFSVTYQSTVPVVVVKSRQL